MHDPVPKNVSKYPIHQTYLTTDGERAPDGGWKFKCPDVWSSARSGKKSIAFRSIEWIPKSYDLRFDLRINGGTEGYTNMRLTFARPIGPYAELFDIIDEINKEFEDQIEDKHYPISVMFIPVGTEVWIVSQRESGSTAINETQTLKLEKILEHDDPSDGNKITGCAFDEIFNQRFTPNTSGFVNGPIKLENVWSRRNIIFHASFIPFDNYQYLGLINDYWNNPIVYQDPNTSPIFKIWTTADLKTPFPILHEHFIIRFTFIISSESQYSS